MGDFDLTTFRQDHPDSPHTDTRSIYFRMCKGISLDSIFNEIEAVDYPHSSWESYQSVMGKVDDVLGIEKLGRVMLVELKPNGMIKPHTDTGEYPEYYRRFHLPIKISSPCQYYTDKGYQMAVGELWEINNKDFNFGFKK